MKTEHIKYILTVANSKSINKASAKLCNYPAQKLSRIICAIEEELNCKIFSKNNKGISITEEGRFVLEKFQEIENILQELEMHKHLINNEELACKTSGKLNIYSLVSNKNTYSFHAIKNFAKDYPNIQIDYHITTHAEVIENVTNDPSSIGIALNYTLNKNAAYNDYENYPELISLPVFRNENVVLAGNNCTFLDKNQKSISLKTAVKYPFVVFSSGDDKYKNFFHHILSLFGTPQIKYYTENLDMFYSLIEQGNCLAIGCAEDKYFSSPHFDIRTINIIEQLCQTNILLINRDYLTSPICKLFVDYLFDSRTKWNLWNQHDIYLDYAGLEKPFDLF